MSNSTAHPLTLSDVERLTGLSREVLRKWTIRYRFPKPQRGKRGERTFCAADLSRLQLLAHLVAGGHRAGKVVPLEMEQLLTLLDERSAKQPASPQPGDIEHHTLSLLTMLTSPSFADALEIWLAALIKQVRLGPFVAHVMPAFNRAVGDAWQKGRLSVHTEHRYTEAIVRVVSRAMPDFPGKPSPTGVLMTTPPSELHTLGLLALQVQLRLAGAEVIGLGAQLPVDELLAAVSVYGAKVVAISISLNLDQDKAGEYLQLLRSGLPSDCALWAGGAGCAALPKPALNGCEVFSDTSSAVLRWQQMCKEHLPSKMAAL